MAAGRLQMMSSWLQEAAPGSTFIATMSSQEEVDEWRSKPKTLGGVNEHVYWGYPNDPAEVPRLCAWRKAQITHYLKR